MSEGSLLKLNLGGDKHMEGWVNVDLLQIVTPHGSQFRTVSMAI